MKFLLKPLGILITLVALIILLFFGAIVSVDLFLPSILSSQVSKRTNYNLSIDSSSISLVRGRVLIEGITLENPTPDFPLKEFITVKEIKVVLRPKSLFSDRIVIEELVIDIDNITFVKDTFGDDNFNTFVSRLEASFGSTSSEKSKSKEALKSDTQTKQKKFLVKNFKLKFNTLTAAVVPPLKTNPVTATANLNWDKEFTNVTNENLMENLSPLIGQLSARALPMLGQLILQSGIEFLPKPKDTLKDAGNVLKGAGEAVKEGLEGTIDSIKGLFGN